ncbi:MAG: hypothetical protein ACI8RA_002953, partial [Chlamydiales bacterium]
VANDFVDEEVRIYLEGRGERDPDNLDEALVEGVEGGA